MDFRHEERNMFAKYVKLFRRKYLYLDLHNPLVQFIGKRRGVHPNDDMYGTLAHLDELLDGIYNGEDG